MSKYVPRVASAFEKRGSVGERENENEGEGESNEEGKCLTFYPIAPKDGGNKTKIVCTALGTDRERGEEERGRTESETFPPA